SDRSSLIAASWMHWVVSVEVRTDQLVRATRLLRLSLFSDDTPKSEMARGRIDRLRMARGRAIAAAVVWRAQMRAAFDDLAGDLDVGLAGVVAPLLASPARVLRHAAGLGRVGLVPRRVPIGGPFPDVADHVVHAVAIGRECPHRRGTLVAVGREVLVRECA